MSDHPVTLLELSFETCRWPVSDLPSVFFCGEPIDAGCPYCAHHRSLAYVKDMRRKDPQR